MIFFLFQILDLFTALILIGGQFGLVSGSIIFYQATYLVIKGLWYWKDPFSWLDIVCAVYMFLMIFGLTWWGAYLMAAYFIYKFSSLFLWA